MRIVELTRLFETQSVPHAYYSFRRMAGGDCHVLENHDGVWKTYFSERGNRFDKKSYASENEACEAMFAPRSRNGLVLAAQTAGAIAA